jgi:hypothetical protein
VIPLARYVTASCLGAQRWVGPGLLFVVGVAVTFASGGEALSTFAEGATWLFPITAWLTVATLNDEDPTRADITSAAAGGGTRVRLVKLAVAGGVGLVLTIISLLAGFFAASSSFTLRDLAAGIVAQLLAVTGGVAVGSICARPLISRPGWAVLGVIGLTVIDLVVPGAPPSRLILQALDGSSNGSEGAVHLWRSLALGAGEVVVLAALLIGLSSRISLARS